MRTYTTILGDTFDKIALDQLGNEYYFPLILKANPRHRDTIIFSSGTTLNIPDLPGQEYTNIPEWLSGDSTSEKQPDEIEVLSGVDA